MSINFERETAYGGDDDEYIKTRIRIYKGSIITNFYNKNGSKKIPEEKVPHKCLFCITFLIQICQLISFIFDLENLSLN